MFVMYDSVDLKQVPNGPHAVAAYVNGRFANVEEARARFPHARILSISVEGTAAHECYDVETGDYSPADVPALFHAAKAAGVWRPCFYANLSTMPAVRAELRQVIKARDEVRLWVAYYNFMADLPADYDAHQFTDRALGRNLDESVCRDDFFRPLGPPAPPPADRAYAARVTLDRDSGTWAIEGIPFEQVKP